MNITHTLKTLNGEEFTVTFSTNLAGHSLIAHMKEQEIIWSINRMIDEIVKNGIRRYTE